MDATRSVYVYPRIAFAFRRAFDCVHVSHHRTIPHYGRRGLALSPPGPQRALRSYQQYLSVHYSPLFVSTRFAWSCLVFSSYCRLAHSAAGRRGTTQYWHIITITSLLLPLCIFQPSLTFSVSWCFSLVIHCDALHCVSRLSCLVLRDKLETLLFHKQQP